jgi:hypothetical protein
VNDAGFSATLKGAKLIARKNPDKPDHELRRVRFELVLPFDELTAEWLGETAQGQYDMLTGRAIKRFSMTIDAYHAKADLSGMGGNAEIVDAEGVSATAAVKGRDDKEHEELTLVFEAFPDAKLLTFLAANVGGGIDCNFKALQLECAT